MVQIRSTQMVSNKLSKFINSLKIKKYRQRERCFLVEGKKNVQEALSSGFTVRNLLATGTCDISHPTRIDCTAADLKALGSFATNNDCLAVVEMPLSEPDITWQDHVIVLDGVGDPGNLGTIIRTLDWFGFTQLVCSKDTTDCYSPKVVNATMGSFARVSVFYQDLVGLIERAPVPAFGADLSGELIGGWMPAEPCILVMGSESHGISPQVKSKLDGTVFIGKNGMAESLNVGIATGICCHHLRGLPSSGS